MNGLSAQLAEVAALIAAHPQPRSEVLLCPPATLLAPMAQAAAGRIALGGQDFHPKPSGAHTGDISADMLADAGAAFVILGHSERRADHGETDALVVMAGQLMGMSVVAAAFEFGFMAGSMGSVVGERFVRGVRRAIDERAPFVCFCASGGARMQEALVSLMQMAKTSAALAELRAHRLPYVSVLTDPTTGGVSASVAMLGDVIVAEPGALIGFAGPRVIEQTVRQILPEGFQRSEFLLEHGAIDLIADRRELRPQLGRLLSILTHAAATGRAEPVAAQTPA